MGDWVAHPSNKAARRILVMYSFRVAMSGEGSPEPHGIRMNNFILCPIIIVLRMNNPSSYVQWSLFFLCFLLPLAKCSCKPKVRVKLGSIVVSSQARNQFCRPSKNGACSMTTCSKIDDLRARSMCVCDSAYLIMKIWPHCNLVLMHQWWL
jgi:hypothetical protein